MSQIISFSTSFIIATASFLNVLMLLKKWRGDRIANSFAWFWVFSVGIWFFSIPIVVFWIVGLPFFSKIFAYAVFICIILSTLPFIYYIVMRFLKRKFYAKIFFWIYAFGAIFYLYFLFSKGVCGPEVSEWGGVEFTEPLLSSIISRILLVGIAFFLVCDFSKRVVGWVRKRRLENGYLLLAHCSMLLYLGAAWADLSNLVGLSLLFVRVVIIMAVLLFYLAYLLGAPKINESAYEI